MSTVTPMPAADPVARGAGQLDMKAAYEAPTPTFRQAFPASLGIGSLEEARGTEHLVDPASGVTSRIGRSWTGRSWTGGSWTTWDGESSSPTGWN